MFSAKFNFLKQKLSKLLNKNKLQTLDYTYLGQPFCDIVSKTQETKNLDIVYLGQPFIGVK
jgi:hypothetical protein